MAARGRKRRVVVQAKIVVSEDYDARGARGTRVILTPAPPFPRRELRRLWGSGSSGSSWLCIGPSARQAEAFSRRAVAFLSCALCLHGADGACRAGSRRVGEQGAQQGDVLCATHARGFDENGDAEGGVDVQELFGDGLGALGPRQVLGREEDAIPWSEALLRDELLGGQEEGADNSARADVLRELTRQPLQAFLEQSGVAAELQPHCVHLARGQLLLQT